MAMKTSLVAGAVAVVAVFAGVVWFARDSAPDVAAGAPSPAGERPAAPASTEAKPAGPAASEAPAVRPVFTDPRLLALVGAPGDDRVELIAGPDGRVIREVDMDPNSAGYRMPLREYAYAGDRIAAIVVYRYFGAQTQVIRAQVTFKSDGSVDRYREETRYIDQGDARR
jgi:hypothetical protein